MGRRMAQKRGELKGIVKAYTKRFVIYDSYRGVCDRQNTCKNVRFQISPSANEQKRGISARFHPPE